MYRTGAERGEFTRKFNGNKKMSPSTGPQRIPKKEFLNKYPKLRTQGIVVHFRGKIYQEIKDFSKESSNYSLLIFL